MRTAQGHGLGQWLEGDPDLPETTERASSRDVLLRTRLEAALRRKNQAEAALHFRAWFIRTGADWLAARVKDLLPRFGGGDVTVRVGDLGYRWGSYSNKGVMHFNWRLLQLPVRLIDYVIAHELVHRFEYNHGPQFWERLECSMPDCLTRKDELKREWHCYATFDVDEQKTTDGARLDGTKCSPCPKA